VTTNNVTVICDLYNGDGSINSSGGTIAFTPASVVANASNQIQSSTPITTMFTGGSLPSVSLLATDNSGLTPTNWAWAVSFSGVQGAPSPFAAFVPAGPVSFTASGSPAAFTWTPTTELTVLPNGTGVQLTGGSLPGGFSAATTYYVVQSSGTSFELAATPGAASINASSSGSGTATIVSINLSALQANYKTTVVAAATALPVVTTGVVVSTAGALKLNTLTSVDTTSGGLTMTLPTSAPSGSIITAEKYDSTGNAVTLSGSIRGISSATLSLLYQNESVMFTCFGGTWWPMASHKPLSALDKRYPQVYSVVAYGADPTGLTDSTTAFTNCISAILGGNNTPSTTTRVALGKMYLPAGSYLISSDILIQSVQGFVMEGAGAEQSIIVASGTGFTTAVLNIDGSYAGLYKGFTVKGDTTETVTNGINLTFTTGSHRSTTGNRFQNIRIRNLNFTNGFSMMGIGTRQVDGTHLENIVIAGQQTTGSWSNTGNWQTGFAVGNGSFGNIYDEVMTRCDAANCYYGYQVNASGIALYGAQPANNFCDFWIKPGAQTTISNIQSQNSGYFLIAPSNFSAIPVTFSDVQYISNYVQNGSYQIIQLNGGTWNFNNFNGAYTVVSSTYEPGTIFLAGSTATRPCVVNFNGLTMNNDRVSCFGSLSHVNLTVQNYNNYAPNTGLYTYASGDVSSFNTGNLWINGGGVTVPQVNFISATGNTQYTVPTGAQTVYVALCAGGGGGGSGALSASAAAGGGSGGSGGAYSTATFQASQLTSSITVSVGAGGTAGAAQTTPGSPGNAGGNGGTSAFGSYLWAHGGSAGGAGTVANTSVVAGAAAPTAGMFVGSAGGPTVTGSAIGGAGVSNVTSGGGAGGGVIAAGTPFGGGGTGSVVLNATNNVGVGGVVSGALPSAGPVSAQGCTTGGGGGGAAVAGASTTAQNGANGATSTGGGGGGGGGCSGGTSSGAGGVGGSGFALIIAFFQ
jgi:hypothetical protein